MFAGKFINAPLQRLSKPEVIGVQGQDFLPPYRIENPVGKLDFNPEQAAIKPMLPADRCGIDQAKAVRLLFLAGPDIGRKGLRG